MAAAASQACRPRRNSKDLGSGYRTRGDSIYSVSSSTNSREFSTTREFHNSMHLMKELMHIREGTNSHSLSMNESIRMLARWLETEVKSRLQVLDQKLDRLTYTVQRGSRLPQVSEVEPLGSPSSAPPRGFPSPIQPSKSPRSRLLFTGRGSPAPPQLLASPRHALPEFFAAAAQPPAISPILNGERSFSKSSATETSVSEKLAQILCESGPQKPVLEKQTSPNSIGVENEVGRKVEEKKDEEEDLYSESGTGDVQTNGESQRESPSDRSPRMPRAHSQSGMESHRSVISSNQEGAFPRLSHTARHILFAMEDESNPLAKWYSRIMPAICYASIVITIMQTAEPPPIRGIPAAWTELSVDTLFIAEITVRFLASPSKLRFFLDELNVIDIIASYPPLIFRLAVGLEIPDMGDGFERKILLCVVPVARLLKAIRHLPKFPLLIMSCKLALEALPTLIYALAVLTLVFASLIYFVEPRDNIETLPRAMWLTMVTMTTVGYGDTIPESTLGSIFTSLLVISSVLFMAMPLGIIGQAFNEIWQDRDCILLARGTRARLVQWGYTADDIPALFKAYGDGDGELSLHDFRDMMTRLAIGLSEARTVDLFNLFDGDSSGTIDAEEFTRRLFPSDYFRIYGGNDGKGSTDLASFQDAHSMAPMGSMRPVASSLSNVPAASTFDSG